jgi:hypothetical protein
MHSQDIDQLSLANIASEMISAKSNSPSVCNHDCRHHPYICDITQEGGKQAMLPVILLSTFFEPMLKRGATPIAIIYTGLESSPQWIEYDCMSL